MMIYWVFFWWFFFVKYIELDRIYIEVMFLFFLLNKLYVYKNVYIFNKVEYEIDVLEFVVLFILKFIWVCWVDVRVKLIVVNG